ncbi:MAG: hypothetical protein CMN30_15625 [Sandaracinus sp.]|nr:hypothetical protein [Sandaracinus sp.]
MRWWPKRAPSRSDRPSADRIRGSLLAGAVADGLAFAHEGRAPGPVGGLRLGRVSDDTELTLATCAALVEASGAVQPEAIAEHFVRWHRQRGFSGLGAATLQAVRDLSLGGHWALVGRRGEMAAGNGAAIRVAPLAFVLDLGAPRGRRTLRDVARITHHSDEAYVGALALALTLRDATRGPWAGRAELFARLAEELPDTRVRDRLAAIAPLASVSVGEVAATFGNGGYVVDAVPLALHAYACWAERADLLGLVRNLVEAGGDCDSIASMAAQCLGALHGRAVLDGTPVAVPDWVSAGVEAFVAVAGESAR